MGNTETSKNAGNAILYECVQTIMAIESESGLRVLAINILGRFLLNRDNNIRYVALNTLQTVLATDLQAVQRHRKTVVECLKDNDISIRRRALALTFGLVNESNVRVLARELLNFLMTAEGDLKSECVAKICQVVDKHSPSAKWRVYNTIRVITLAGEDVSDNLIASLIQLIASTAELQGYSLQRLWLAAKEEPENQALLQALLWCLGEFANQLMTGQGGGPEEEAIEVSDDEIVEFVEGVLRSPSTAALTKQYGITCCAKMTLRLPERSIARLGPLVELNQSNVTVEIQQRACEFRQLMKNESIRNEVFKTMPAAPVMEEGEEGEEDSGDMAPGSGMNLQAPTETGAVSLGGSSGGIEDLLGNMIGGGAPDQSAAPAPAQTSSGGGGGDLDDLLGDLLGPPSSTPAVAPATAPAPMAGGGGMDLNDLLGGGGGGGMMPAPAAAPPSSNTCMAYQKNGLTIMFACVRAPDNAAMVQVNASFTNSTGAPMTNFVFQQCQKI